MQVEQITSSISNHGEGAVWWARSNELRFLDMLAGAVISVRADGSHQRIAVGSSVIACLRPRAQGGAILARERDVALCDSDDLRDPRSITGDFVPTGLRFNEGCCDPDGRFYCGTMAYDRTPAAASLYRLESADAAPVVAVGGVSTSNGLDFSPDGSLAYYNDTDTMRTDVFDYSPTQGLTNRRPLVRYQADEGRPDGLCVDGEGGVWVCMHRASTVRRYEPSGRLSALIQFPVTKITSCAFGGTDLATLFVTTSRDNLLAGEQPAAGSLFAVTPGVKGKLALPFGG